MLLPKQIKAFQQEILAWYKQNKRDLPWRHSRDPYTILISEVMLQQTQVDRVIPKFIAWMHKFPTLADVAKATTHNVLAAWSGLGYNRRALYLKKTAEILANGFWPQKEEELRKLPGIGQYTARAILCFAFDKHIAVVDTNVKKVILVHFKHVIPHLMRDPGVIQTVADQLLPIGKAYEWNQALMDYASANLKKHKIPISKQSKFKDSDRYYRGQILKLLIAKKQMTKEEVVNIFHQIPQERLEKIIRSLEKDNFITSAKKGIELL